MGEIERRTFIGYPVDSLNVDDVIRFANSTIELNNSCFIAVQNANKIFLSDKFPYLKNAISEASLILPENAINIGMSILGRPLKARNMGGVRIMEELLKAAESKGWGVYFIGATKHNLEAMISRLGAKHSQLRIAGYRDGYFRDDEEDEITEQIAATHSNLLFVGMGSPKQELFIAENLAKMNVNIAMGVGGSFNVFAGIEKPAPGWTKYGLEWLYRSVQDPTKLKRYLIINTYFVYKFMRYLFSQRSVD